MPEGVTIIDQFRAGAVVAQLWSEGSLWIVSGDENNRPSVVIHFGPDDAKALQRWLADRLESKP